MYDEDESKAFAVHAYSHILQLPPGHRWMRPLRNQDLDKMRVFYVERYDSPVVEDWKRKRKKNFQAKKNKEKAGKLFRYKSESEEL